jgi:hypothetical protein
MHTWAINLSFSTFSYLRFSNMTEENPYASPLSMDYPNGQRNDYPVLTPVQETYPLGVFRKGNLLVMNKLATLPDRCVKSNEPAVKRIRRSLSWHPPLIYVTILISILIYVIIALIVRKQATIYIGLSEKWVRKRRKAILIGWLTPMFGFALFVVSLIAMGNQRGSSDWYAVGMIGGIVIGLGGIIYGIVGSQMVTPTKIDDHFVWLKGVSPAYLAELPEFPFAR